MFWDLTKVERLDVVEQALEGQELAGVERVVRGLVDWNRIERNIDVQCEWDNSFCQLD